MDCARVLIEINSRTFSASSCFSRHTSFALSPRDVIEWPRRFKLRFAGGGLLFDLGAQFLGDVVARLTVHQLQLQQQQIALPSAQPRASAPGRGRRG